MIKILSALHVFDFCDPDKNADDVLVHLRRKKKNTLLNGDRDTADVELSD